MKTNIEIRQDNLASLIAPRGARAQLARDLGTSDAQIGQWLIPKGHKGHRSMSHDAVRKIEGVRGREEGWMDHEHPTGEYLNLPVLDQQVAAGLGALINPDQTEVLRSLEVAEWWAQKHLPRDPQRVRIWTVRGDSMAPEMQHGDVLFVDIGQTYFEAPGIYVLNWGDRPLVKRLMPEVSKGRLALISTNKSYQPEYIEIADMDQLRIIGKVIVWWTLRSY